MSYVLGYCAPHKGLYITKIYIFKTDIVTYQILLKIKLYVY